MKSAIEGAKRDLMRTIATMPQQTTARLRQNNYDYAVALSQLVTGGFVEARGLVWDEALFIATEKGRRWLEAQEA